MVWSDTRGGTKDGRQLVPPWLRLTPAVEQGTGDGTDTSGYWPILADTGRYWRLLADTGGYWPKLADNGGYWLILAKLADAGLGVNEWF